MKKIPLKICGITNVKSVEVAYKNKIKSLGFASKSLNGPNTASDKKIQSLESVSSITLNFCQSISLDNIVFLKKRVFWKNGPSLFDTTEFGSRFIRTWNSHK